MSHQPERALTHISLDFLIVKSKLCRNESSAREGIDTSIYCVQLFDHFSVEMSHQPERALTFLREDLERMSSKFEEMSYFKRQIQ